MKISVSTGEVPRTCQRSPAGTQSNSAVEKVSTRGTFIQEPRKKKKKTTVVGGVSLYSSVLCIEAHKHHIPRGRQSKICSVRLFFLI